MDELNKAYSQNIDDTSAFNKMPEKSDEKIIIKAIGVGGGGNNAVNHMYREGINNVSFVNINTDRQALLHSVVPNILEIGDGLAPTREPHCLTTALRWCLSLPVWAVAQALVLRLW